MIRSNIQAQIEQKETELYNLEEDILRLGRVIDGLKKQESILLSNRSDLIWKIEELKEEINNA